jgi:hypothetical protein
MNENRAAERDVWSRAHPTATAPDPKLVEPSALEDFAREMIEHIKIRAEGIRTSALDNLRRTALEVAEIQKSGAPAGDRAAALGRKLQEQASAALNLGIMVPNTAYLVSEEIALVSVKLPDTDGDLVVALMTVRKM